METKMDVNQEKMDAWLNEIKAWRKETTACWEATEAVIKYICRMYQWSSWKVPEAFIWNAINTAGLSQFQGID
jgi:hypothetical protein